MYIYTRNYLLNILILFIINLLVILLLYLSFFVEVLPILILLVFKLISKPDCYYRHLFIIFTNVCVLQ